MIYLDYNATAPVHPKVLEAALPYLQGKFGNPSSAHAKGFEAKKAMAQARKNVASAIGAHAHEIVFTSGGSESNNIECKAGMILE